MDLNTGISRDDREAIATGLSRLLADSYTLYLKTHNYHWNVTGPQFNTLHQMFEDQYTELASAVDEIAVATLRLLDVGWYRRSDRYDSPVVIGLRFNQPISFATVSEHLEYRVDALVEQILNHLGDQVALLEKAGIFNRGGCLVRADG